MGKLSNMILITIHKVVAILGLSLALAVYLLLNKIGYPQQLCINGATLAILVVAIFWSAVILGSDEGEDDE